MSRWLLMVVLVWACSRGPAAGESPDGKESPVPFPEWDRAKELIRVSSGGPPAAPSADPKALAVPAADSARAAVLVKELGVAEVGDRELAQVVLAQMGRRARPAMTAALAGDPSPDVRERLLRLLPAAELAEARARIDAFVADADGRFEHDLPGEELFRKADGREPLPHELYREIFKAPENAALLAARLRGPEAAGASIGNRRDQTIVKPAVRGAPLVWPGPPDADTIAAILLAEIATPTEHIVPRSVIGGAPTSYLCAMNATIANALANPATPRDELYRRAFGRWCDTRTDAADLSWVGNYIGNFRAFKGAAGAARRAVTTAGVEPAAKVGAMMYLYGLGEGELPLIRRQLRDERALLGFRRGETTYTLQVRDVALSMCLHNAGLDIRDFGFEVGLYDYETTPDFSVRSTHGYGFTSDDARAQGHKKWAELESRKLRAREIAAPAPQPGLGAERQ